MMYCPYGCYEPYPKQLIHNYVNITDPSFAASTSRLVPYQPSSTNATNSIWICKQTTTDGKVEQ